MPVIKIRKPKESTKIEEPKTKKIKIKKKDESKQPPKIKLKLKKKEKDLAKDNSVGSTPTGMKLKLNLKKEPSQELTPSVTKVPRFRIKPVRVPGEGYDSEASFRYRR